MKKGILLQGGISSWTNKIVDEYLQNFPEAEILISTWTDQNIDHLPCESIQMDPPPQTTPFNSTVNHQKVGTLAALEKMDCDLIMKCRTDQFVHNKDIFRLYEASCAPNKIMIPNYVTLDTVDYFASDLCQMGTKDVLLHYWNSIAFFDGTYHIIHPEIYLTANYIIKGKKDVRPWKSCLHDHYYVKDYKKDFQIEWEKLSKGVQHKIRSFDELYPICVKPFK